LVRCLELPNKVFCAGIYSSNKFESKEMPCPDTLLSSFMKDIASLNNTNKIYNINLELITVELKGFVCDAVARAALKNIQAHSGDWNHWI
jgi:hypothetical protein